jgi:hypothetical protein
MEKLNTFKDTFNIFNNAKKEKTFSFEYNNIMV